MRRLTILVALAVALAASASEAAKPPSKPGGSKPAITKTQAPKGGAKKSVTTKASGSIKSTKSGSSLAKGSSTKSAKAKASTIKVEQKSKKRTSALASTDGSSRTSTSAKRTTSTNGPTPTIDFTATGVGQKLQKNGALRSKIEAKLLAAGYTGTVYEAAFGFKNMGQLNAATNMVQNHGYDFDLLKLLMTGRYVDPKTHDVYRAQQLPDGTVTLVKPELATSPTSTLSLGQAKQAITAGAEMPELPTGTTTGTSTTKTLR